MTMFRSADPWFLGHVHRYRQAWAAAQVVLNGRTSSLVGDVVAAFEAAAAVRIGVATALAIGSASSGFELVLQDLGIGLGDDVVVPVFGWMSVPGAAEYAGARLRLADVDQGLHSGWGAIEAVVTAKTRAVVIVHMRGFPCPDTVRIAAETKQRGLVLIEDCAQAWGTTIGGRSVGTFGDYGVFSTQHYKLVVTGEGGVVVARDRAAMDRLRWLSGRTTGLDRFHPWPRNVRMPEIVAATGIAQLGRLPGTVERLRALAAEIAECFGDADGLWPQRLATGDESNGVSVPVWCDNVGLAERLTVALRAARVPSFRPGLAGDLHNALSWPIAVGDIETLPGLMRLPSYVDIPVPRLRGRSRHHFISSIESAVKGV